MDFERPYLLLLLLPAWAAIWLGQRRSLTSWSLRQRRVCYILRCFVVSCLIAAIAGPSWVNETAESAVVFLKDVSNSIVPAARTKAAEFIQESTTGQISQSGEIDFARSAAVRRAYGSKESTPISLSADGTNIAEALRFSAALLPSDRPGRIVLLSDGNYTDGESPKTAAAELSGRGVQVDIVRLPGETRPDAAITKLDVPENMREGEMVKISTTITATVPLAGAKIRLYQNHLLAGEISQDLAAGTNAVSFAPVKATGNVALYEVEVVAAGDVSHENNRARQAVIHGGAGRTLLIDAAPDEVKPLAGALEAAGLLVDVRPPAGFPKSLAELEDFDLVIFSDAPAEAFRQEQLQMLASWVKDFGGGFLMIGGEHSFGAGGYALTPLATLLPVRLEREQREETPVAALLVILDRSGSMTAIVNGQPKMALANEGAALSLDVLQSRDIFGVWAVDTRVQPVVPLGPILDKPAASRKIAGITAGGGGIYVYTSLAEALPQMRDTPAKLKHIILFADASDAEEKTSSDAGGAGPGGSALDLAAALLASQVTLSVVALGTEEDKDTAFLRDLASKGGGRFYLTADAMTLPRLFTQETMRATQSSLREDVFMVKTRDASPATAGLTWDQGPPLFGLNIANAKPGSEILLETNSGEPLLTTWRYGLGQSAAFLSDAKARWAAEWLAWDGYGKFWGQLARLLLRPAHRNDLTATLEEAGSRLRITTTAIAADGTFRNGLPVSVTLAEPNSTPRSVTARQVVPGQYTAEIDAPKGENAVIGVTDGAGRPVSLAWTRDESREYRVRPDAEALLTELSKATGGLSNPKPEDIFRPAPHPVPTYQDLAPWLLLLAVVLWPVDIWLRRREWSKVR